MAVPVIVHCDARAGRHRLVVMPLPVLAYNRPLCPAQLERLPAQVTAALPRRGLALKAVVEDHLVPVRTDKLMLKPLDCGDAVALVVHDDTSAVRQLLVVVSRTVLLAHHALTTAHSPRVSMFIRLWSSWSERVGGQ